MSEDDDVDGRARERAALGLVALATSAGGDPAGAPLAPPGTARRRARGRRRRAGRPGARAPAAGDEGADERAGEKGRRTSTWPARRATTSRRSDVAAGARRRGLRACRSRSSFTRDRLRRAARGLQLDPRRARANRHRGVDGADGAAARRRDAGGRLMSGTVHPVVPARRARRAPRPRPRRPRPRRATTRCSRAWPAATPPRTARSSTATTRASPPSCAGACRDAGLVRGGRLRRLLRGLAQRRRLPRRVGGALVDLRHRALQGALGAALPARSASAPRWCRPTTR